MIFTNEEGLVMIFTSEGGDFDQKAKEALDAAHNLLDEAPAVMKGRNAHHIATLASNTLASLKNVSRIAENAIEQLKSLEEESYQYEKAMEDFIIFYVNTIQPFIPDSLHPFLKTALEEFKASCPSAYQHLVRIPEDKPS